jgi:hypothetical protein
MSEDDDDAGMQDLEHSQPSPRQLPDDIIQQKNDHKQAAKLETLLLRVPEQYIPTFYTLAVTDMPTIMLRDNIITAWEATHSSTSANTKP